VAPAPWAPAPLFDRFGVLPGAGPDCPALPGGFVVCERLFTVSWSVTIFPLSPKPAVGARDAGAFCASLVGGGAEPLGLPVGCAAVANARPAAMARRATLRPAFNWRSEWMFMQEDSIQRVRCCVGAIQHWLYEHGAVALNQDLRCSTRFHMTAVDVQSGRS
jgi:hypothetical protein